MAWGSTGGADWSTYGYNMNEPVQSGTGSAVKGLGGSPGAPPPPANYEPPRAGDTVPVIGGPTSLPNQPSGDWGYNPEWGFSPSPPVPSLPSQPSGGPPSQGGGPSQGGNSMVQYGQPPKPIQANALQSGQAQIQVGGPPGPPQMAGPESFGPPQIGRGGVAAPPGPNQPSQPGPPQGGGPGGGQGFGQGTPGSANNMAQGMWDVAQGFMDPDSEMFGQLMQRQRQAMGQQTAAQQRSAALAGAEGGFGAGASPEMMQMQAQYGAAGTEALGSSLTNLQLAAPQMGLGYGQAAGGLQQGVEQGRQQESQFGQSLGQRESEFGRNMGQRESEFRRNLAQGASQFGQRLGQQGNQFGQSLGQNQGQFDINAGFANQGMLNQGNQFAQNLAMQEEIAKQNALYNQQQLALGAAGMGLNFPPGGGAVPGAPPPYTGKSLGVAY